MTAAPSLEIVDLYPLPMLPIPGDKLLVQRVLLVDVVPRDVVQHNAEPDIVRVVHDLPRCHRGSTCPEVAHGRNLAEVGLAVLHKLSTGGIGGAGFHPEEHEV